MRFPATDAPSADDVGARRLDGQAQQTRDGAGGGDGWQLRGLGQGEGVLQGPVGRVGRLQDRHHGALLAADLEHAGRDAHPPNRLGKTVVVGDHDDLPGAGDHLQASGQPVDAGRVHGLHGVVEHQEPEGAVGQRRPGQEE